MCNMFLALMVSDMAKANQLVGYENKGCSGAKPLGSFSMTLLLWPRMLLQTPCFDGPEKNYEPLLATFVRISISRRIFEQTSFVWLRMLASIPSQGCRERLEAQGQN